MEIIDIVIKIIALVIITIGVIMIYDARKLSKKLFSFGEQNSSAKLLKIV